MRDSFPSVTLHSCIGELFGPTLASALVLLWASSCCGFSSQQALSCLINVSCLLDQLVLRLNHVVLPPSSVMRPIQHRSWLPNGIGSGFHSLATRKCEGLLRWFELSAPKRAFALVYQWPSFGWYSGREDPIHCLRQCFLIRGCPTPFYLPETSHLVQV